MGERALAVRRERRFRCGTLARWLPRVLAGSVLAAALLASFERFGDEPRSWLHPGRVVVLAGALGALWIVRQGAELRVVFRIGDQALLVASGNRRTRLEFERIESIGYAPLFSSMARPLPAALLIDRQGSCVRLPALLREGDRLVELLLTRSERADLAAWVDARRVRARMGRASLLVGAGYLVSGIVLAAGLGFHLR